MHHPSGRHQHWQVQCFTSFNTFHRCSPRPQLDASPLNHSTFQVFHEASFFGGVLKNQLNGTVMYYTGLYSKTLTSLGLLILACLPILCRLWERARRWGRCLCSPPSNWAGWLGGACAVQRQLYQETASHDEGQLTKTNLKVREQQKVSTYLKMITRKWKHIKKNFIKFNRII